METIVGNLSNWNQEQSNEYIYCGGKRNQNIMYDQNVRKRIANKVRIDLERQNGKDGNNIRKESK